MTRVAPLRRSSSTARLPVPAIADVGMVTDTRTGAAVDESAIGRGHGGNQGGPLQPVPEHVRNAWAEEYPPVTPFRGCGCKLAADLTDQEVAELSIRVLKFLRDQEHAAAA